jgi:hypothetical protein
MPLVLPSLLQAPIVATIQVDIDESLLKQNKKQLSRRQSGLQVIAVGSSNSSSGSTSSSTKSLPISPLRQHLAPRSACHRDAMMGLQMKMKNMWRFTNYPHRRVDADTDVELERALSRGEMVHTLAQVQAEEVPVKSGRDHEKGQNRKMFDIAAQRLQDVTNTFGLGPLMRTHASLPPLDTYVFGICSCELTVGNHLLILRRIRPPKNADRY